MKARASGMADKMSDVDLSEISTVWYVKAWETGRVHTGRPNTNKWGTGEGAHDQAVVSGAGA